MRIEKNPSLTKPNVPEIEKVEATRPVKAGAGKHRGDRRDMSKQYSNNAKSRPNHVDTPGQPGKRHKG